MNQIGNNRKAISHAKAQGAKGANTSDPSIPTQYPVDLPDLKREALYRSVAAIPILINSGNEVWGVVTATTSRANVFVRDKENIKVQNVEMIRDIARIAALLAGIVPPPTMQEKVAKGDQK